jgi:hypothetical protein
VYLALQLRESIEKSAAHSPVVVIRHVFFEEFGQLPLPCVLVGFKALVKGVGPVAIDAGVSHTAYEVAHPGDEGVANRSAKEHFSSSYEGESMEARLVCLHTTILTVQLNR